MAATCPTWEAGERRAVFPVIPRSTGGSVEPVCASTDGTIEPPCLNVVAAFAVIPGSTGGSVEPDRGLTDGTVEPRHDVVAGVRYQTEKYFACGFKVTIALVDCSGCNWNSSDSEMPSRSAPSRFRIGS